MPLPNRHSCAHGNPEGEGDVNDVSETPARLIQTRLGMTVLTIVCCMCIIGDNIPSREVMNANRNQRPQRTVEAG